jgi:hypothetical protein
MNPWMMVVLRIAHVVAGSFWLGAMLMNAAFLLPSVRAAGPAGGVVMKQVVQVRLLPVWFTVAVVVLLLSGGAMLWWLSGGLSGAWLRTPHGMALACGAALGLLAAGHGQFATGPVARRLGQIAAEAQAAGGPPSPAMLAEIQALLLRLQRAASVGSVMVVLAAALMAAARYLG